jgi:hypothetical protein
MGQKNTGKLLFTADFQARVAALPIQEQLWLSEELFQIAVSLQIRAARPRKVSRPKVVRPKLQLPEWKTRFWQN